MSKNQQSSGELKQLEDARACVKGHIEARKARGQAEDPTESASLAEIEARIDELTKPKPAK